MTDAILGNPVTFRRLGTHPEDRAAAARPHPLRNVFLMVGIAIVVFMAFTAYSIRMASHTREQLTAIKNLYFPVLQSADANLVRLDKIQELYLQAVELGDRQMLEEAHDLGVKTDGVFANMLDLYPQQATDVTRLRMDLRRYLELAQEGARSLLDGESSGTSQSQLAAAMNASLERLRNDLRSFRQSSYDRFTATLDDSQHEARSGLLLGLAIGGMNLGFMGVLVYFIRNNVRMMRLIEEQNATLERRVEERTAELSRKNADISAMLQNMKLGVSTVIQGNRIHPEYSAYLRTIVDREELANEDLIDVLFGHSDVDADRKDQMSAALGAILGEDKVMFEWNGHLLTREMCIETEPGVKKIVQLDWNPIVNELGAVEKVLLISQDVTHLRELERQSAEHQDELDVISRIIGISPEQFDEFLASARGFIKENRRLIRASAHRDAETVATLFRNLHTLKGNARTVDLAHITNAAHLAEQRYHELRRDESAAWDPPALLADLDAVETVLERYETVNRDKLGRRRAADDVGTVDGSFIRRNGRSLLALMADIAASSGSLAASVGKPPPTLKVEDSGLNFRPACALLLKNCLVHIVRNSLDHGIESAAERVGLGKPPQGQLDVAVERDSSGGIGLTISDDGRGLDLRRLYEVGVRDGTFAPGHPPARETVADLIFRPGVTTAAGVTQLSGRGVGMDAVRNFLEQIGASIRLRLSATGPELGFVPFTLVITLPKDAYVG